MGRITHETQILQTREAAEGPSLDARERVERLLRNGRMRGAMRLSRWRVVGRGAVRSGAGWKRERVGRITHERQRLQTREVAEGLIWDARELVAALLRDGEDERSEAAIDMACCGAGRGDEWRWMEARAGGAHHAR